MLSALAPNCRWPHASRSLIEHEHMPTPALAPLMSVPLIGWMMYRRVSRQFGRQPFTPKRQVARLALLGVVTLGLIVLAIMKSEFALPIAAGMLCGAAIGMVNLRLTRFEWTSDGDYYYPHPYVGAALSLLLVGRLVYRYAVLGGMPPINGQPPAAAGQSPLTYGLLAVLLGYYLVYLGGLMIERHRHHRDRAAK
jgi:hypothetical protein